MAAPRDLDLGPEQLAALDAALASDPALDRELAAIDAALRGTARRELWAALAVALPHAPRPAAAVLSALEAAARAGGEEAEPGG